MPSSLLLDPEVLAERAAILAVENDFPDEEALALARFWHSWAPGPPPPSRYTWVDWALRPGWPQTVRWLNTGQLETAQWRWHCVTCSPMPTPAGQGRV